MNAIEIARDILGSAPEINPSNYDHDQVCQMNAAANEAYDILDKALAANQLPPAPVAEELSRKPVASVEVYDGVLAGIYANELVEYLPDGETMLYTHPQPAIDVYALAEFIRTSEYREYIGPEELSRRICNWIEEQAK